MGGALFDQTIADVQQIDPHAARTHKESNMNKIQSADFMNDAYQVLCCADWYLEELYEDLEWESGKEGMNPEDFEDKEEYEWRRRHCRAVRLKNQIELVEILRKDYGIRDSILIWISW